MAGEYGPFSFKTRMMMRHRWCSLDDFRRFVNTYKYQGFHNKANREALREAMSCLGKSCPYSPTIRFPKYDLWVYLDHPEIVSALNQLATAIDIPETLEEQLCAAISSGATPAIMSSIYDLTDSKETYRVVFSQLTQMALVTVEATAEESGIYTRETFENKYNCIWDCSNIKGNVPIGTM